MEDIQVEIGTEEQWRRIDDRVPGALHAFNSYADLTVQVAKTSVNVENLAEEIIFGLSRVCIEESQEILLLAANEYPSGAAKLLRSLYERTVTLLYIRTHPEKSERFRLYAAIQEHRAAAAARKLFSDEQLDATWKEVTIANVEENYKRAKGEFQRTKCKKCKTTETAHTWDVDLATMAERVGEGMTELYLSSYSLPTLHAHSTFASAYQNMTSSETSVIYSFQASPVKIDLCVLQVFTLTHRVLRAIVELFKLPLQQDVNAFGDAVHALWQVKRLSAS